MLHDRFVNSGMVALIVFSLVPGLARAGGPPFPASNVAMLANLPLSDFPDFQTRGADIWGYESPSGRQYMLVMFTKGTAFVEVTDPNNPVVVDYVSGGVDQVWRDAKVYLHYAYIVSDGSGVGLQIVDLSDIDNGTVSLVTNTDLGSSFETAHNIAINVETGFAYLCGGNVPSGGGILAVDLSTPESPVVAGAWTGSYVHDLQVVSYTGGPYDGREIAFAFGGGSGMYIVDVTDKSNMFTRPGSPLTYTDLAYCHQGWLTEDRRHVVFNDELDEFFGNVLTTTTYIANVEDLDSPTLVNTYTTGLPSTDHNLYTRGDYVYNSNYSSGLRIWDISDIDNPAEVGFFDSYPDHDNVDTSFPGAWGAFVGFDEPYVFLNDRDYGFFVLDATDALSEVMPPVPARPAPDPYYNRKCVVQSCSVDTDCEGESHCVPEADGTFPGTCYVPRNRYLGIAANDDNAGLSTARRVSVQTEGGPVVLGWMGEPDTIIVNGPECPSLGSAQLVSALVDTPYYADWSAASSNVAHLTGCHISPVQTYLVEAIASGSDLGDESSYSFALSLITVGLFGDITGGGGVASPPNGFANLVDVQACILGFQVQQTAPSTWLDIVTPGLLVVNMSDAFSAVLAFQGEGYSGQDPCECAGLGPCP